MAICGGLGAKQDARGVGFDLENGSMRSLFVGKAIIETKKRLMFRQMR